MKRLMAACLAITIFFSSDLKSAQQGFQEGDIVLFRGERAQITLVSPDNKYGIEMLGSKRFARNVPGEQLKSAAPKKPAQEEVKVMAYAEPGKIAVASVSIEENANVRYGGRMEDRHISLPELGFFGVFDGHGGQSAAQYIVDDSKYKPNRLVNFFNDYKKKGIPDGTALETALFRIEEGLWALKDKDNDFKYKVFVKSDFSDEYEETDTLEKYGDSGSTAVVAKLTGDTLTVANVGDSRAVLIRDNKIIQTTTDHKPSNPKEKARLAKVGYKVPEAGPMKGRVIALAVSRSIGDVNVKESVGSKKEGQAIVNPVPDIYTWNIQSGDVLILASDGIWDVMDIGSQNRVLQTLIDDNVINFKDTNKTAKKLVDIAMNKLPTQSKDNITIMIVKFK